MNEIFQDLVMEGVVCVYLDNILIYTKTMEEHYRITRLVLEQLHKHKLFLQHDKCEFECTQIKYLGLVVAHGLITMDPIKVTGVAEWPVPKTVIPWVCKLLSQVHRRVLASCMTTV